MKRITFLDGQTLHDFHLNIMQKNISEAIKQKTTYERYDMLMLLSPYNYYFCEPFVSNDNRHSNSTAELNPLTFSISSDEWITPLLELPENTSELYILANYEDFPASNCFVDFYYRTAETMNWIKVNVDSSIVLPTQTKYAQVKVHCRYTGNVRPTVYDFALMSK